jgi:hypothetical protein
MAYEYQMLTEPDAIRLVVLQPSNDLETPLECGLISTTLSHCQYDLLEHYTALSYVWGDPSNIVTIKVDGYALSITASLDAALRHLRDTSRMRKIWADAICINQNDFEERNQQVRQMASVYSVAQHTIIWIGEGTADTDKFFKNLKLLSSQKLTGRRSENPDADIFHILDSVTASKDILSRQWFKRVWVLQELVRSRDPWVQCGRFFAKWEDMKRNVSDMLLAQSGKEKIQVFNDMAKLYSDYHSGRFRNRLDQDPRDPTPIAEKLLSLLISRRGLGVADARDMLFAHVGLLGNVQLNKSLIRLIEVDYRKEESLVFFDIARFLTEAFQDYRIISFLEYRHPISSSNTTSWVPEWTVTSPPQYLSISSALRLEDTISARYFPPNPQCLNFWVPKARVLACRGWTLARIKALNSEVCRDIISKCWKQFHHLREDFANNPKYHCKVKDLLSLLGIAFKESYEKWQHLLGKTPDPANILTIIGNHLESLEEPFDAPSFLKSSKLFENLEKFSQEEQTLRDGIQQTCNYLTDELLPRKQPLLFGGSEPTRGQTSTLEPQSLLAHLTIQGFGIEDKHMFHYRKLATLDDGTPALVPDSTQPGDVVAMLMRRSIPLILRPIEVQDLSIEEDIESQIRHSGHFSTKQKSIQHFNVVGECFVEGLMYGEAYEIYKAEFVRQPRILALH